LRPPLPWFLEGKPSTAAFKRTLSCDRRILIAIAVMDNGLAQCRFRTSSSAFDHFGCIGGRAMMLPIRTTPLAFRGTIPLRGDCQAARQMSAVVMVAVRRSVAPKVKLRRQEVA